MPDPGDYWSVENDPYLDPELGILKNIPGLQTQKELDTFEKIIFQAQFPEAVAFIEKQQSFSLYIWQDIHRICFGDIFEWAGDTRTVRIEKTPTVFAYPEHIKTEADRLFVRLNKVLGAGAMTLEEAAELYTELNVVHPFREGNGRTQRIIFAEVLRRAGYRTDYSKWEQQELIRALIEGYHGEYSAMVGLMKRISEPV